MGLRNTEKTYGKLSKFLHWGMFVLVVGMICVGYYMHELPKETPEELMYKIGVIGLHKAFGIIILATIIFRFIWRARNTVPKMPEEMSGLEKIMAHMSHLLLYVLVLIMPLSGWLMSSAGGHKVSVFGLFTMPSLMEKNKSLSGLFHEIHEITVVVLIVVIILHAAFALYHHFIKKDDTLKRMMPSHGKGTAEK